MPLETISKVLDASSGSSSAFNIKDNTLLCKLVISGSPSANIKAFLVQSGADQQFLKLKCATWNGASVALHVNTGHADDDYSASGVVYTEDSVDIHFFK